MQRNEPTARNDRPVAILYAIVDEVADAIIGGIQLHKHDAAAIRTFGDIARTEGSMINRHPTDFALMRVGFLMDDHRIDALPSAELVLTGAQWQSAQQAGTE